jgi:hypothetical protein
VTVASCNDCHTEGYAASGGSLRESQWLTGRRVGFKGPWGITYAPNLRLLVQGMTEEEWMQRAGKPVRPPMPWFSLKAMTDSDRRCIYRYIRSLGPAGTPAPSYVAPGGRVITPYEDFTVVENADMGRTR